MSKINETQLTLKLEEPEVACKYKLAIWTDRTDFIDRNTPVVDADKLLELVAFDESGEVRFRRFCVDEDFFVRDILTESATEDESGGYFDKAQFLDIDTKRSKDGVKFAIGGGKYHLPVPDAEKLVVRYYYKFDEDDGMANVYDKRLVRFE